MSQSPEHPRLAAAWLGGIGRWPVWRLRPWLRCYVLAVIAAGAAAAGAAALAGPWRARDAVLFALLLAFGVVSLVTGRRSGDAAGSNKDAQGVWQIAAALLLPPFYALVAPAVVFALLQWQVRRSLAYRRVFSAAAVGLAGGAASLAFHTAWGVIAGAPGARAGALGWAVLALACAVLRWVVNNTLVVAAIRLDDPAARLRDVLGSGEGLYNDVAEACVGVLVAVAAALSPVWLVIALPCGTLLQRSARHAQLVHAARTDAKTGLLSAVAWQQEAAVQVARAVRARSSLAAAMIDIDHFKRVNDTYGHLAGDGVLAGVAAALAGGVREYDLVGRFGGEEFSVLLPDADAAEALRVAERLRVILGRVRIPAGSAPGQDAPCITVSIGVAVLGPGVSDLTDLLTAADAELYRAKQAGRNCVRLTAGSPA